MQIQGFRPHKPSRFLIIAAIFPALAVLLPLAYLVIRAASLNVAGWSAIAARPTTLAILINSAGIALATPLCAALIAVPLAFLTERTDLPGRRFWMLTTTLPLAVPDYVICFALISTFGPKGSVVQLWLEPLGVESLPEIYGWFGALLALTLITYPYLLLTVRAGLQGLDPSMEEAARSLGKRPLDIFWQITLPQLRPALVAGGLIAAMYALQDFSATTLMHFNTFTRAIFLQYRYTFNRHQTAALALILVGLILLLLWLEYRVRTRATFYSRNSAIARPQLLIRLGKWKWLALLFCSVMVCLGLVLPVGVTLLWFVQGFTHTGWSYHLAAGSKFWEMTWHSFVAAGLAAIVTTLGALPVAILAVRFPSRLTTLLERCSYIGFGLPGVVVALALVYWGANYVPWLYQSLPMLVFAYLMMFLPQAIGTVRGALLQVNPAVEESARSLGRTSWQTLQEITLPLIQPGILAGAMLVFLTALKELPATLLLAPIGFNTLSVHIWKSTESVSYSDAAAGATVMLFISLGLTWCVLCQRKTQSEVWSNLRLRDFD
jgi:iron(III) transport system permease protein